MCGGGGGGLCYTTTRSITAVGFYTRQCTPSARERTIRLVLFLKIKSKTESDFTPPPDQHFMNQPWAYVGCGDCVTLEKSQSTWLFCLNPVRSKKNTDNNSIWICYKRSLTQKKKKNPHERLNKLNRCTREREGGFWYQTHDGIIVYGPWFDIHYGTETNCLCVCALNDCLKRSPSWEMNFTYLARGVRIRNSIWGGKRRFISTVFQLKEKEKFPIFNPKSK